MFRRYSSRICGKGFLRNVLPDGSLYDYRTLVQRTFGAKMVPDNFTPPIASALGAIETGVTCVSLVAHPQYAEKTVPPPCQGGADPGVRAVFAYGNPVKTKTGQGLEDSKGHKFPERHRATAQTILFQR